MSFSLRPQGVGQRVSWWFRRPDYSTPEAWRGAPLVVHPDEGGCFDAGQGRWLVRETVRNQVTYLWVYPPATFPPCPAPSRAPWILQTVEGLRDYARHLWLSPAVHLLGAMAVFAALLWGSVLLAAEETVHFLATAPPERNALALTIFLFAVAAGSLALNSFYHPRTRWTRLAFLGEVWLLLLLLPFSYGDLKPSFQLLHEQAKQAMDSSSLR